MVPCSPPNIINFRPSPDTPMFTSHFTHIIKAKQNFGGPSLSLFLCWKLYKLGELHCSYSSTTTENLIRASLLSTFVFNPLVLLRKMAYSKTFLLLGLVFAVVLLVSSEVSARKLLSWAKYMPLLFFFKPKCLFFLGSRIGVFGLCQRHRFTNMHQMPSNTNLSWEIYQNCITKWPSL